MKNSKSHSIKQTDEFRSRRASLTPQHTRARIILWLIKASTPGGGARAAGGMHWVVVRENIKCTKVIAIGPQLASTPIASTPCARLHTDESRPFCGMPTCDVCVCEWVPRAVLTFGCERVPPRLRLSISGRLRESICSSQRGANRWLIVAYISADSIFLSRYTRCVIVLALRWLIFWLQNVCVLCSFIIWHALTHNLNYSSEVQEKCLAMLSRIFKIICREN